MTRRLPAHPRLPSPPGELVIGLMGGSFDPPHSGHAHVIETARRALGLDRVWVMVSPGNPLKKTQTALVDRLSAARRRLGGPRTIVSDIESVLGTRYTIHTLRCLKKLAPHARFVWIIGGDNLRDFHRWREWKQIARLAPIAVIARPGREPEGRAFALCAAVRPAAHSAISGADAGPAQAASLGLHLRAARSGVLDRAARADGAQRDPADLRVAATHLDVGEQLPFAAAACLRHRQ